ncbi:MAG: hypothetical protein ACLFWM_00765 [Actinomycetota bacterium]
MFIEYSTELDLPDQTAAELLTAHVREMEGMGAAAYRQGEELRARVGPGSLFAKEVVMALGPPSMSRRGLVMPVRWRATGAEALFPSLEGELTVEASGDRTVLDLRATYEPPLGSLGNLVDRALLARLARATVADWVGRIGDWMESANSAEGEHHLDDGSGSHH